MTDDNKTMWDMTTKILHDITDDFVSGVRDGKQIMEHYHISYNTWRTIRKRNDLFSLKKKFDENILEKRIEKSAEGQVEAITNLKEAFHILSGRFLTLVKSGKALSSTERRDAQAEFAILSKEYRLDHDKPTDHVVSSVSVNFPAGFRPIVNNPEKTIDAEYEEVEKKTEEVKEKTKPEAPKEEKVKVKTNMLRSPLG